VLLRLLDIIDFTCPCGEGSALLETELKAYARSIGVAHLGIGDVTEFSPERSLLESQREQGAYPPFTEGDIPLRTDPRRILPGAKSILAIAVSYLTDDAAYPKRGDTPRGLVSRYAWGKDYHPILEEKLEAIVRFMQERVGRPVAYRSYVDTGPPIDRAVARRSGIGWFGKNACIFVPGSGSWVFLGQIITDVPLKPDPQLSRECGTCDRCMRACPTGAIERPFWVNPHKCLSYITQMPGWIPKEYRRLMGRHLWGCDICQIVCPWNWEAIPEGDAAFAPDEELTARPALIRLLTISNAQFRQWFGETAMAWRGKKTIQRNACICLGNIKDPQAVPALIDRLKQDVRPVIRGSAAWALGEIGGVEARNALLDAAALEVDPEVRAEIADALAALAG